MKGLQWLATVMFVAAGIALLCSSGHAEGMGVGAYAPTRFTVTDAGTAGKPDVVLIPGLASSKSVWDAEAKLLAPNYSLHLVQVNGFAGAPAGANGAGAEGTMLPGIVEELHGYIAATKMHPVVVGHSLGGLLALMLAEKHPGDVRKMVIVDTLPYYAVLFNQGATVETTKPMAEGIKAHMMSMPAEEYAAGEKTMLEGMSKTDAGQKAIYESSVASDTKVVAEALCEDLLTDMRGEVGSIQTPTLVLYEYPTNGAEAAGAGKYEEGIKADYKPMPHVTLVKMDGARHFIMYDEPAQFDAAMEGFLK
jgi:pimeloyl-ACP methyl ester carboxylesterase